MTKDRTAPSPEALVDAFHSGALTDQIFDRLLCFQRLALQPIVQACAELHNAGKIDLFALTENPAFQGLAGHRFFMGQQFLCEVIPKLDARPSDMMRFVDALVEKGGEDLAANQPNAAFRAWCEADIARAHEVVCLAKQDDQLAKKFLSFALAAGNMVEDAAHIVEKYCDRRQVSAAAALGRMSYVDAASARGALATLVDALEGGADDLLAANVLSAGLDLAAKTVSCRATRRAQSLSGSARSLGLKPIWRRRARSVSTIRR